MLTVDVHDEVIYSVLKVILCGLNRLIDKTAILCMRSDCIIISNQESSTTTD